MRSCRLTRFSWPLLALAFCCTSIPAQCGLQWAPGDGLPGSDGVVYATTMWDPDGAGPSAPVVVVGGDFDRVATLVTQSIATWDPATGTWSALGGGLLGSIAALAVLPNGDLLAAGYWITPTGVEIDDIARWNGTTWVPLGFGSAGAVSCLRVLSNGDLLVGGDFTTAGGVPVTGLAVWDGTTWAPYGAVPLTAIAGAPTVNAALELPNGDVVIAGRFSTAGGVAANSIARWDGTTWQAYGGGVAVFLFDRIRALHLQPNGDLIVGGLFTLIDGMPANCVARWDGAAWHPLGAGLAWTMVNPATGAWSFSVRPNGDLVVGGVFRLAGGVYSNGTATWNGAVWSPMGAGGSTYTQLVLANGDLIAGGAHTGNGEGLSRWDGASWSALATGFNHWARAFAQLPNGDLVTGGYFTYAGASSASRIAVHDGAGWSPIGSGLTSSTVSAPEVRQLAVGPSGDLYVAGYFTHAGGVPAQHLARWDGATWWPLTSNAAPTLMALLARANGDLVVAGNFSSINGVSASRIARWDGTAWHALGTGLNTTVRALAELPNGDLIAAGDFLTAGGVAANRVARWDGTSWSAMGAGLPGSTSCLAVMADGSIVATGTFGWVRQWDGATWNTLANLAREPIVLLPLPNGDLLAGGLAGLLSSSSAETLVRWSGGSWTAVPGWPNGRVVAMLQRPDGRIVLGGEFKEAGGQASAFFAELESSCPALSQDFAAGCPSSGGSNTLVATTLPWVDSTFRATGTGLPSHAFVLAVTSVTPVVPGFSLFPTFAEAIPGCDLHVAPDILETLFTTTGSAQSQLYLPDVPPLVGVTFYHQMIAIEVDPQLAFVAITATNALQLTAGQF